MIIGTNAFWGIEDNEQDKAQDAPEYDDETARILAAVRASERADAVGQDGYGAFLRAMGR